MTSRVITTLPFVLLFSACATVFNTANTDVEVKFSKPVNLVVNKDTFANNHDHYFLTLKRSAEPLVLKAFDDSTGKTVTVPARNSAIYYLNFYPSIHLWTGLLIDTKTKRRYTYPHQIYIDMNDSAKPYLKYFPVSPQNRYHTLFKLSPMSVFGIVNPCIEFAAEQRTSAQFSTQIMFAWLMPNSLLNNFSYDPEIKGFKAGIEERWYFKHAAPISTYLSLGMQYMKNSYRDIADFAPPGSGRTEAFNVLYKDTFTINKQTVTGLFKTGRQVVLCKNFALDVFAGFGIRYRDIRHLDRLNPSDRMLGPIEPNIYYISNNTANDWMPVFTSGFRLSYAF